MFTGYGRWVHQPKIYQRDNVILYRLILFKRMSQTMLFAQLQAQCSLHSCRQNSDLVIKCCVLQLQ